MRATTDMLHVRDEAFSKRLRTCMLAVEPEEMPVESKCSSIATVYGEVDSYNPRVIAYQGLRGRRVKALNVYNDSVTRRKDRASTAAFSGTREVSEELCEGPWC